jgi:hypothetical protein
MAQDPVGLGPLFCRAEWIRLRGDEVSGIVRAPRQRAITDRSTAPVWQFDPLVMDAGFQIAANWDGLTNKQISIPLGVGRITVGRIRARDESAHVHARVVRVQDPDVYYDLTIASDAGDLFLRIESLHLRRIASTEPADAPRG